MAFTSSLRPPERLLQAVLASLCLLLSVTGCGSGEPEAALTPTAVPLPTATRVPPQPEALPQAVPVSAQASALARIRQEGIIRAGILYNAPPFSYLNERGEPQGYEVDLLRAVAERWGVDVTFTQVTRQTRFEMLEAGEIDVLAASVVHNRSTEPLAEFTGPIFTGGLRALVRLDSGIDSLGDLQNARLGTTEQINVETLQEALPAAQIQAYPGWDAASLALLEEGVLDALIGPREQMMLLATSTDGTTLLEEPITIEIHALAAIQGDTPLRDFLDLTLQQISADGVYGEIFSSNFYRYTADAFPAFQGETVYSLAAFPAELSEQPSAVERIQAGQPLRVAGLALEEEAEVFNGQVIVDGYNRAVVNEMARRWNVPVEELPSSEDERGIDLVESGSADLAVGVRPDQDLIGRISFSVPYYQRGIRVAHMRDVTVNGIGNLDFRPVLALPPFDISTDLIEDNNGFPDYEEEESFEEAFDILNLRATTALVGDEFALALMAQAEERVELVEERYRPTGYGMAVQAQDFRFIELVTFTLQDMYADGTLDRLREQYFSPYLPEGEELEPLEMLVLPP